MKQLSSTELNSMSKEDLAAMVLQMQQLHQQLQQQQKQMEQQIHRTVRTDDGIDVILPRGINGYMMLYHFLNSRLVFHSAVYFIRQPFPAVFSKDGFQLFFGQLVVFNTLG